MPTTRPAKDLARAAFLRGTRTRAGQRLINTYLAHQPIAGHSNGDGELALALEHARSDRQSQAQELAALRRTTDDLLGLWEAVRPHLPTPTLDMLTEQPDDSLLPPLDRTEAPESDLSEDQRQWREQGVLIKREFVPEDVVDAYWEVRSRLDRPHGWESPSPYLHVPEVLQLSAYQPLLDLLESLIGEPMAVTLNLTGLVSTERNWHQDDYLNPPTVNGWYAAVWFALGDVDPDAGPFQYVPGSHRWPVLRRDRVKLFVDPSHWDDGTWPRHSEAFLDDLLTEEIERRGAEVHTFEAGKGDILIWHARLVHRGSAPKVPGRLRASFISHYTGLSHWGHHEGFGQTPGGGHYALSSESVLR